MNYTELAIALEERMQIMTFGQRFRFLVSWYVGLPYEGGLENFITGTDCSGTVCGPLWLLGFDIRCTANALYEHIFTRAVEDHESTEAVMAVFCRTKSDREHFGSVVPAGYATHVAPVIGRYVVMNAFDPIQPMASSYVYDWYASRGFDVEWRALDIQELRRHSIAQDMMSGVDPVLQRIRPAK